MLFLGRCKSTFHQFLTEVMERVQISVALKKEQTKTIFLPHCTWDKFGDILANSGGRSLGLFDELTAFFSTMNMYSSVKMQVSDTREYQDFLQMYTGKSKSRETSKLFLNSCYIFFKTIGSFWRLLYCQLLSKETQVHKYTLRYEQIAIVTFFSTYHYP